MTAPVAKENWKRNAMYARMPSSESTIAEVPFRVRSSPTDGPTISVPTILNGGRLPFRSESSTVLATVLRDVPDWAPTCGTRTMT